MDNSNNRNHNRIDPKRTITAKGYLVNDDFNKEIIFTKAVHIIKNARKNTKKIKLIETPIGDLYIEKENWKTLLTNALEFFEKQEDYIKCSEIKKIIDDAL